MLHLCFHPSYDVPRILDGEALPSKNSLVRRALEASGAPLTVHAPEPMPRDWLAAVHDPDYVDEVLNAAVPREKERRTGFPITPAVAQRTRHTVGGTWLACRLALAHGFAANCAGGSHHALYDTGAGYCVLNDLAVAAHRLIAEGTAERILICDLDVHQGDGTAALVARRPEIVTLSIHAERNFPVRKAQSTIDVALPDRVDDAGYLAVLADTLPAALDRYGPDLVLYQAGVDPHDDDRLGRLALSDEGLAARDRFVISEARRRGIALASTLGGGYGTDMDRIAARHAATILTLAQTAATFAAA